MLASVRFELDLAVSGENVTESTASSHAQTLTLLNKSSLSPTQYPY